MTDKQKRFCDEYLIDCNATRAYLAAYPTVKSDVVARKNGSRLLTYADVKAYISERMEEIRSKRTADAQEIMEYLTSVVRGESESEVIVTEFVGDGVSEARSIKKRPDEKERLKAAELIGKRYSIFTDKVKHEGTIPVVIDGGDSLED